MFAVSFIVLKFVHVLNKFCVFFFWSRRRVNSLILKSYPLCRPNLLYWEANLPSICVNLSLGKYAIMNTSVYFL